MNRLIDAGADVIKTAFESGYAFVQSGWPLLTPDEAAALVETAHERGKLVSAHVTSALDLAQRETRHFSAHFAKTLLRELKTSARLHKNPSKSAGFRVLKAPDVPSVLLELGYVTSRQDLKLLVSDTWRARVTDSETWFEKQAS